MLRKSAETSPVLSVENPESVRGAREAARDGGGVVATARGLQKTRFAGGACDAAWSGRRTCRKRGELELARVYAEVTERRALDLLAVRDL